MLNQINFPPSERNYKKNQPKLPPSNFRDVNCITQHMPFEQDVFVARMEIRFKKVTVESDQESKLENNLQGPKRRKDIAFSNPIHVDKLDLLKRKSQIPNPTVNPQIPPNIPSVIEKTIINQKKHVPTKEQDKIPMNIEQSIPLDKEPLVIPQSLLAVPSFYRPPRKPPKEVPKPMKKKILTKL